MLIENSDNDFLNFFNIFIISSFNFAGSLYYKKHFHMCLKYDTMLLDDLSMVGISSTK